eukprot:jgi/Tetstr1/436009/TSEL_024888.t1
MPSGLVGQDVNPGVDARLLAVSRETEHVKRFTLAPAPGFRFLPGQWVDLFPPENSGVTAVGGYSFASTPLKLQKEGTFDLLIREARHPVAQWLHRQAQPGCQVRVNVGGAFHIRDEYLGRPMIFLAGGIGITPLYSILRHVWEQGQLDGGAARDSPLLLLYSVKDERDFALCPEISEMARGSDPDRFQVWDAVTEISAADAGQARPSVLLPPLASSRRITRIITATDVQDAVSWATERSQSPHGPVAFLCGPPAFSDTCAAHLSACGLRNEDIIYERWW